MADGFSVSPLSPKGTYWEMKPSGSITWRLSHHSGLGLGVGKRSALPGSATFRLQSCLPWESIAVLLWIMMCGNIGFYFCKSSAGYKSWWQDPWAQREDSNGRSTHSSLLFFFPSLCLTFYFFPSFFLPSFFHTFFFHLPTFSSKRQLFWRTGVMEAFCASSLGFFRKPGNLSADGSQHQCQNGHRPCDSCSFGQQQITPVTMPGRRKWSIIWVT